MGGAVLAGTVLQALHCTIVHAGWQSKAWQSSAAGGAGER